MNHISMEHYVVVVNYFIDRMHSMEVSESSRYTYSRALYFLKEAYEHQDSMTSKSISTRAWERLSEPVFKDQYKYIASTMLIHFEPECLFGVQVNEDPVPDVFVDKLVRLRVEK